MTDEFKAYWLRDHFDLTTSAASIAWSAWQESRSSLEAGHQKLVAHCENLASAHGELVPVATVVAAFIGGAKDRLGRPDVVSDEMRAARARILELATHYGVQGGHHTYLDQCAALLNAAATKALGSAT